MCWIDRTNGKGFSFADMETCDAGGPCWFALNENDLKRIQQGLNK